MSISITIPNTILDSARIPRSRLKEELLIEISYTLYARGITSMGAARKLAKVDKWTFLEGLAERSIERHYDEAELKEDIEYAAGHQ